MGSPSNSMNILAFESREGFKCPRCRGIQSGHERYFWQLSQHGHHFMGRKLMVIEHDQIIQTRRPLPLGKHSAWHPVQDKGDGDPLLSVHVTHGGMLCLFCPFGVGDHHIRFARQGPTKRTVQGPSQTVASEGGTQSQQFILWNVFPLKRMQHGLFFGRCWSPSTAAAATPPISRGFRSPCLLLPTLARRLLLG